MLAISGVVDIVVADTARSGSLSEGGRLSVFQARRRPLPQADPKLRQGQIPGPGRQHPVKGLPRAGGQPDMRYQDLGPDYPPTAGRPPAQDRLPRPRDRSPRPRSHPGPHPLTRPTRISKPPGRLTHLANSADGTNHRLSNQVVRLAGSRTWRPAPMTGNSPDAIVDTALARWKAKTNERTSAIRRS